MSTPSDLSAKTLTASYWTVVVVWVLVVVATVISALFRLGSSELQGVLTIVSGILSIMIGSVWVGSTLRVRKMEIPDDRPG